MSKRHIQNLAEQIASKKQNSEDLYPKETHYQSNEEAKIEDNQVIKDDIDSSIKLRAYQIHIDKGGSDLDNWLEAEQSLKSSDKAVSSLLIR